VWAVDAGRAGPSVMRGQNSKVFSTGTYGSVTSYNDVGDDSFTLLDRVFLYMVRLVFQGYNSMVPFLLGMRLFWIKATFLCTIDDP
jgi:hypothetical protein